MRTHIPFRNWCEFCVKGKCKSDPHRKSGANKSEITENKIPITAIDYTFPRQKEGNRSEHGSMPILVMKNDYDKWVAAVVVPQKGSCEYAFKAVSREIQNAGYNRIIIKSDQEPSIKELLHAVKRERESRKDRVRRNWRGRNSSRGVIK